MLNQGRLVVSVGRYSLNTKAESRCCLSLAYLLWQHGIARSLHCLFSALHSAGRSPASAATQISSLPNQWARLDYFLKFHLFCVSTQRYTANSFCSRTRLSAIATDQLLFSMLLRNRYCVDWRLATPCS